MDETANIAIKCTYNNGGEDELVGFSGTCSEDIIKWNIDNKRVWCSNEDCGCRKYYDKGFKGKPPEYPCYESALFVEWEYGAGSYHTGKRKGVNIHLSKNVKNKYAILTTRFPDDEEIDRKIIGFFKISAVENDDEEYPTTIYANPKVRVRLPLDEAKGLYFWNYYKNKKGGAKWGTGLVRYLSDEQVNQVLYDIRKITQDEEIKKVIDNIIGNIKITKPSGYRMRDGKDSIKHIYLTRKYGIGGEGKDHKKLKEWIFNNPKEIGIDPKTIKNKQMEYTFPSGDTADLLFEMKSNKYIVVEIETIDPNPGIYQALKYKVLKCMEIKENIDSKNVESFLVAWNIPKELKNFCYRYGIKFVEKKL